MHFKLLLFKRNTTFPSHSLPSWDNRAPHKQKSLPRDAPKTRLIGKAFQNRKVLQSF